jgi:hypothetical protein
MSLIGSNLPRQRLGYAVEFRVPDASGFWKGGAFDFPLQLSFVNRRIDAN